MAAARSQRLESTFPIWTRLEALQACFDEDSNSNRPPRAERCYRKSLFRPDDGTGPCDNDDYFLLAGQSIEEDTDTDKLVGGCDVDWFFFDLTPDKVALKADQAFANELDDIL